MQAGCSTASDTAQSYWLRLDYDGDNHVTLCDAWNTLIQAKNELLYNTKTELQERKMNVFRETIKFMKTEIENDQKYLDEMRQSKESQEPQVVIVEEVEHLVE